VAGVHGVRPVRGQLWPVRGRAWCAGRCGRYRAGAGNWRQYRAGVDVWPCIVWPVCQLARVVAVHGAGCIGARVVAGAGCVPFDAKKYYMHLQWHFA